MSPAVPGRPAPDRLRHKTVSAAVADSLRQQILNGDLPPGVQLRQDALAEEFGISRIPIREALLHLEASNLVKIMPHRGAVVSGLSLQEVEDIFQLRVQLEPQLLLLSAPHLSHDEIRSRRARAGVRRGAGDGRGPPMGRPEQPFPSRPAPPRQSPAVADDRVRTAAGLRTADAAADLDLQRRDPRPQRTCADPRPVRGAQV